MSQTTKHEVLAKLRRSCARAGTVYKRQLLDQAVALFGYHRKAAIRALRAGPPAPRTPGLLWGRPRTYHPETLLPIVKPIWCAASQPCGVRLRALLPEWLPAGETDHQRLDADLRQTLLRASPRTWDRLLVPLRVAGRRFTGARPGSLLRQSIPIRGEWTEQGAGGLELDTVTLCGGGLDDRHLWMLDGVYIGTDWAGLRALENRGLHATVTQIRDLEASLPFPLRGVDSDNGGEFINHPLVAYLGQRPKPVLFTRARPYRKNDNAHVEPRNWTRVRQHFGYERYDNPAVMPLINTLCTGGLGQLLNHFLPTLKLERKERRGTRTVRKYGDPQTPCVRVLAAAEVRPEEKARLKRRPATLNPFQLGRDLERQMKHIEAARHWAAGMRSGLGLHQPTPKTGAREAGLPPCPDFPRFQGGKKRVTPFLAQRAPARPSAG